MGPLFDAIEQGNLGAMRKILASGVDVNCRNAVCNSCIGYLLHGLTRFLSVTGRTVERHSTGPVSTTYRSVLILYYKCIKQIL